MAAAAPDVCHDEVSMSGSDDHRLMPQPAERIGGGSQPARAGRSR
jgi:hypothetical protein